MVAITRSQVTKAGRLLRKMHQGSGSLPPEQVRWALDVLVQFRASHSTPLTKANNGLRSMLATEGIQGRPTQRLKRVPTIIDKLVRHPTMALPKMQDIGGCRAVCTDIEQLRRLERRIRITRPPVKVYDYISKPKSSGYRAVHLSPANGSYHIWKVTYPTAADFLELQNYERLRSTLPDRIQPQDYGCRSHILW